METNTDNARKLLQLAEFSLAKGNNDLATDFFSDAIKAAPEYLLSYRNLFEQYKRRQNTEVLYAFYDKRTSPTTFDFITFLILAELERKRTRCRSIHVVLVGYHDEDAVRLESTEFNTVHNSSRTIDNEFIRWRLHNVLIPCCGLLESCSGITTCSSYEEAEAIESAVSYFRFPEDYSVARPTNRTSLKYLPEEGNQVRTSAFVRAPQQALSAVDQWLCRRAGNRKVVTISLREAPYNQARNSSMDQWAEFVRQVDKSKYCLVIVRDTYAEEDLPAAFSDCLIYDSASWNVSLRMALYQKSYLNLTVSNGPIVLMIFCDLARYLVFKMCADTGVSNADAMEKMHGIRMGDPPPVTYNPFQRLVWEEDHCDILTREFVGMCAEIDCSTAY